MTYVLYAIRVIRLIIRKLGLLCKAGKGDSNTQITL